MILTKLQIEQVFKKKEGCTNCGRYKHDDVMAIVKSHEQLREALTMLERAQNCWCPNAVGPSLTREHHHICRDIRKKMGI